MGNLNDYTMIEKQYIEPNDGFSQTVVVQSATYKTIYISGQIDPYYTSSNYCCFQI
jgi:enamine deaminase RidA (YjgF/YER057c/UK114 family)